MLVGKKGKIIIDHHLEVAKISLRNSNNHKKVYLVLQMNGQTQGLLLQLKSNNIEILCNSLSSHHYCFAMFQPNQF